MHSADYAVAKMSVCPSVTRRYSVKMAKHILKIILPLVSHTILVFPYQAVWQYCDADPLLYRGVECF